MKEELSNVDDLQLWMWYFCRKFCKKKKPNRPRSTLSSFRKYLVYFCATLMSFIFKSILFKIHSKDVNIKISPWPTCLPNYPTEVQEVGSMALYGFLLCFQEHFFFISACCLPWLYAYPLGIFWQSLGRISCCGYEIQRLLHYEVKPF